MKHKQGHVKSVMTSPFYALKIFPLENITLAVITSFMPCYAHEGGIRRSFKVNDSNRAPWDQFCLWGTGHEILTIRAPRGTSFAYGELVMRS